MKLVLGTLRVQALLPWKGTEDPRSGIMMRNVSLVRRWPRTLILAALPLLLTCAASASEPPHTPPSGQTGAPEKPRLIVFLVVDQLRGDLLDRYASLFQGGLKRLLSEGMSFSKALHDHAQTETSPGHATLSTGVFPSRAGIPSNAWREGPGGETRTVYNVVDPGEALPGVEGLPGSSPAVLRRTGLADWLVEANPEARVVSVSGKDRAAVLMGGKGQGEVFWFEAQAGRFVTSTYYKDRSPSWLDAFNKDMVLRYVPDSTWTSTVPPDKTGLSAPDTAAFEGDGVHSYFPHAFSAEVLDPGPGDLALWFEGTPMLDEATLDVALLAMGDADVGQEDGRTDFLSISFSQTDRVGHAYGPLSREQMDNLLRLDRVMERLFAALDELVGPDRGVIGFRGGCGVMNNPERIDGGGLRLSDQHRFKLEQALSVAARKAGTDSNLTIPAAMTEALRELEFVGPAYTHAALSGKSEGDSLAVLFRHSYTPGRAGGLLSTYGVEMWWDENVLAWGMPVGTTHGSPFHYDRWVPLILFGPGIEAGVVDRPVRPMDLAPTLAGLAGISYPDDLDGEPLLKKEGY